MTFSLYAARKRQRLITALWHKPPSAGYYTAKVLVVDFV
jgi:hypothetical protein